MSEHHPMILTTKNHRECHDRWRRFKEDRLDRVRVTKNAFEVAEASVRAFGPHIKDVAWIKANELYTAVYGGIDPLFALLDAMDFPDHNPPVLDRTVVAAQIKALIQEHEQYGSDGNYMPRSVILGWIARKHDALLGDLAEVA